MHAEAFLKGYMHKEALSKEHKEALSKGIKEGLRFAGYGLGGAAVGASLGAGVGQLFHEEATPVYVAGGAGLGYMLGPLQQIKANTELARKQREKLRKKEQLKQKLSEQDQRNLDVLEDLAAGDDI